MKKGVLFKQEIFPNIKLLLFNKFFGISKNVPPIEGLTISSMNEQFRTKFQIIPWGNSIVRNNLPQSVANVQLFIMVSYVFLHKVYKFYASIFGNPCTNIITSSHVVNGKIKPLLGILQIHNGP